MLPPVGPSGPPHHEVGAGPGFFFAGRPFPAAKNPVKRPAAGARERAGTRDAPHSSPVKSATFFSSAEVWELNSFCPIACMSYAHMRLPLTRP